MAQWRREGNRRYKDFEGNGHARSRNGLHARGGDHVGVPSREHSIPEGNSVSQRDEYSVDGVRVHEVWRSHQSATSELSAAQFAETRCPTVVEGCSL